MSDKEIDTKIEGLLNAREAFLEPLLRLRFGLTSRGQCINSLCSVSRSNPLPIGHTQNVVELVRNGEWCAFRAAVSLEEKIL